jgi:GntR family transcriptional regulator
VAAGRAAAVGAPPAVAAAGVSEPELSPAPGEPTVDEVRGAILALIVSGELPPGRRIGSERELARRFGVGRSTLRQALGALAHDGLLTRVPGRGGGTFVKQTKIERDLSLIVGVPAMLRNQGVTSGTRVISAGLVPADDATAKELQVETGALVQKIVRLRLADGSPFSVEQAVLPADRFPGLLELPLGNSLYELLEREYGTRPAEACERIEVVPASDNESQMLEIAPGDPLLSITRTTTGESGDVIEHSHDLFRADRIRIVVRASGSGSITRAARSHGQVVELSDRTVVPAIAAD